MVRKLSVASLFLSSSAAVAAPEVAAEPATPSSPKWGVEVDLIQPFVPEVQQPVDPRRS